jgi:hypothetical protein
LTISGQSGTLLISPPGNMHLPIREHPSQITICGVIFIMKNLPFFLVVFFMVVHQGSAQDTVHVSAGWNIIGSVNPGFKDDVVTTDPPGIITTSFYGYDPGMGYLATDTLRRGLGYWVKVSADGVIILDSLEYHGCGVKRVEYDGLSYGTVQIGSQCWMASNLNIGTMIPIAVPQSNHRKVLLWKQRGKLRTLRRSLPVG